MALPTSLALSGLAPIGSEPPTNSEPVSVNVGRSLVFLFSLSRADWLRAVLGNRLKASAGPEQSNKLFSHRKSLAVVRISMALYVRTCSAG